MGATRLDAESGAGSWAIAGIVTVLIAGVVFLIFELVVASIVGPSPFGPTRMISAIGLGQGALPPQPSISLNAVLPVALVIHFINSAVFGTIFGVIAGLVGFLRSSRGVIIGAATLFGFVLWIVNFYVIAPLIFPWFLSLVPGMFGPEVRNLCFKQSLDTGVCFRCKRLRGRMLVYDRSKKRYQVRRRWLGPGWSGRGPAGQGSLYRGRVDRSPGYKPGELNLSRMRIYPRR